MSKHNELFMFIILSFLLGGFIGYTLCEYKPYILPGNYMSDEQIYQELLSEYEFYMKASGMWEKHVSDVTVHINNNKMRVFWEIEKFRRIACNGTNY